ncbi:holo-ACP synthase [Gardnerella vaginalis]|uniref:holo-ACP synthase n=1 Tax=Gardnerella vaginalis TaxID=2702 RepID=UPI001FF153DA|nr:4'-phosphopantetheinyl transferase superfamily protein [Gardnerella vaginalis]
MIAGIGHDLVNVAQFAEQMHDGDGWRALFSQRELRQCAMRAHSKNDAEAMHIAARWAGKEAVIKSWCEALSLFEDAKYPYTLDNTPWASIEILDDSYGCPSVHLDDAVNEKLMQSLGTVPMINAQNGFSIRWHVSLSHDGLLEDASAIASAFVILEIA